MNHEIKIISLTTNNYPRWLSQIEKVATFQGVEKHINSNLVLPANAPDADRAIHRAKETKASILIETNISQDVATLLGQAYSHLKPHDLMQFIRKEIASATEADRQELEQDAENLKHHDWMSISEYILRHLEIRNKTVLVEMFTSENEEKTIKYILEGIPNHPDYNQYIEPLTIRPPSTIAETKRVLLNAYNRILRTQAQRAIALQATDTVQPWYPRGRGNGRRGRGMPGRRPNNPNWGRGQRRPLGNYPRPPGYTDKWCRLHGSTTHGDSECYHQQSSNRANNTQQGPPVDNAINFADEHILDSGAYPTHLTRPQATTANGRQTRVTHSGPVQIHHSGPQSLHIKKAVVAPEFTQPLLSVNQMCQQHDILFQQNKAYLLPKSAPPTQTAI